VKLSKFVGVMLVAWLVGGLSAMALTFEYADGAKFEGDIVTGTPAHLQVRTSGGYTNLEWGKLSQETLGALKQMAATNSSSTLKKLGSFIEPYIEIPEAEIIKKTQVTIKPVPRLDRPQKGSLIGAMFQSPVGLLCLVLLYAANVYAGYEIARVRAYSPLLVCGIAAVGPVIGPVVFLCLPTNMGPRPEEEEEEAAAPATGDTTMTGPSASYGDAAEPAAAGAGGATKAASHAALPQTQVFKRGQFTFNRRFIETKFSSFFTAVRRGADKDMVLVVKAVRGEYVATRISRIASNDMHLEVHKGGASQEVPMPFAEIQEIHLKHKDA
jgi:hypothetical protein